MIHKTIWFSKVSNITHLRIFLTTKHNAIAPAIQIPTMDKLEILLEGRMAAYKNTRSIN